MHEKGAKALRFTLKLVKLFIPDGLCEVFKMLKVREQQG